MIKTEIKTTQQIIDELKSCEGNVGEMEFRHKKWSSSSKIYTSEILKIIESLYLDNIPKGFAYANLIKQKAKRTGDEHFAEAIEKRLDGRFLLDKPIITKSDEKPSKLFKITSVHRDDIKEVMNLTEEQTSKITDEMMEQIADKMENDYCEQLFWNHLPSIAEKVIKGYGIALKKGD